MPFIKSYKQSLVRRIVNFSSLLRRTIPVVLLIGGWPETILSAQKSPPSLTIRSTTTLINVSVFIEESKGQNSRALTAQDFVLTEHGHVQHISFFAHNTKPASAHSGDAVGMRPEVGEYANYTSSAALETSTVLLLDALNNDRITWAEAWPSVLQFLRQISSPHNFSVYSIDLLHGLRALQDPQQNINALNQLRPDQPFPADLSSHSPFATQSSDNLAFSPRTADAEAAQLIASGKVAALIPAINVIAQHMAGVPGSKSLIWFAGTFPEAYKQQRDPIAEKNRLQLVKALSALASTGTVIYPVDARGLIPDHSFDAERQDIGVHPLPAGEFGNSLILHDFSNLLELAHYSGGKAYFNSNGLMQSMLDVLNNQQDSYTLGFYSGYEPDDKFHPIQVKIIQSNVKLRYRPGYWFATPTTFETPIINALSNPMTANQIHLEASLEFAPETNLAKVTTYVDKHTIDTGATQHSSKLDFIIGQVDYAGTIFAQTPYQISVLPNSELLNNKWTSIAIKTKLRKQTTMLKIVVMDDFTREIGAINISIRR